MILRARPSWRDIPQINGHSGYFALPIRVPLGARGGIVSHIDPPAGRPETTTVYEQVQRTGEFQDLRRRLRQFVFPMSAAFLLWYLLYVLLASYAPAFMATVLAGDITVGLVIGLLQFVSTFAITAIYVHYANRRLDPRAERLRERIEGGDT
jgi:uncharacterized membrane protein (DUF485 family)